MKKISIKRKKKTSNHGVVKKQIKKERKTYYYTKNVLKICIKRCLIWIKKKIKIPIINNISSIF